MTLPRQTPVPVDNDMLVNLMSAAQRAADSAAPVTRNYFRTELHVDNKAGVNAFDPVTVADREAELAIRTSLNADFPEIGFYGEEHLADIRKGQLLWVVDPIDGTRAYMSGMPIWGTLIGLFDGQDAILGLLDQPILQERFIGWKNTAQMQTPHAVKTLRTRTGISLAQSTFYCTTPDMFETDKTHAQFARIRDSAQLTRYGGDCYAYALLASGFVDVVLDCDLKPYDIMALIPIIRAAGGVVSNWHGESAVDGGFVVASGSAELHQEVLEQLNAVK